MRFLWPHNLCEYLCQYFGLGFVPTLLKFIKLICLHSSIGQAVLLPRIHQRNLQARQISTINLQKSYLTQVTLNNLAKEKTFLVNGNLKILTSRSVRLQKPRLVIQTNASTKGWGARRSSHRRYSIKKGVLKNFTKFTGKHLCQSLFFNNVSDQKCRKTHRKIPAPDSLYKM